MKLTFERRARPRGGRSLIPGPARRHICAALVRQNRRNICAAARQHGKILIDPVNNVEHYFHFIFDLALPLWHVIDAAPDVPVLVVREFGILSERIKQLFPSKVEVIGNAEIVDFPSISLLGMNPRWVHTTSSDVLPFKTHVCSTMGISPDDSYNLVALIERLPAEPGFADDAGAARRSLPNHAELAAAIESSLGESYEFRNVQLENLAFQEQIRLFNRATLVIGQHGGGLANSIWMRPGSRIIEFSYQIKCKNHFRAISKMLGHKHFMHETSGPHTPIDVDLVIRQLSAALPDGVSQGSRDHRVPLSSPVAPLG